MDYTVTMDEFIISTDKSKLDMDYVHRFLSNSYWSPGVPLETVTRAMENSLCFGVYDNDKEGPASGKQIGYARMVTDLATFAYLADVFIDEDYRGKGLGKWLVKMILDHPDLKGLRRIMLATRDAHKLYEQFGFTLIPNPDRYMVYNPQPDKNK